MFELRLLCPEERIEVLGEALDALDPDELTPREALEQLYQMKRLAKQKHD